MGSSRSSGRVRAFLLAPVALIAVAALGGCGGGGVDGNGFTANDRRAARNALSILARTSVYDAAREISLTEAHVPDRCVVHIQTSKPLTFRVFMTWVPNEQADGLRGSRGRHFPSALWLRVVS